MSPSTSASGTSPAPRFNTFSRVPHSAVRGSDDSRSPSPSLRPITQCRRSTSHVGDVPQTEKGDQAYIKRPENAFILFRRKCFEERLQGQEAAEAAYKAARSAADAVSEDLTPKPTRMRRADLSKDISARWRSLPVEERAHWEALAKEKKKEHERLYPDYVYRPLRKEHVEEHRRKHAMYPQSNFHAKATSTDSVYIAQPVHGRDTSYPSMSRITGKRKLSRTADMDASDLLYGDVEDVVGQLKETLGDAPNRRSRASCRGEVPSKVPESDVTDDDQDSQSTRTGPSTLRKLPLSAAPTQNPDIDAVIQRLQAGDHERALEKSRLLGLRGSGACIMLDALQSWLDKNLKHTHRRKIVRLNADIALASGELPPSLFVPGVHIEGQYPMKYGGFADVFYGTLEGKPVAIKRLRMNQDDNGNVFREFCKEALVWRQLKHPNVLPLIGIDADLFEESHSLAMISLWMEQGTLMTHLRSPEYNAKADRQRLIIEVAQGLEYLHGEGIAHGDLHGGNVLITDDGHPCLTDFGMTVA